MGRLSKEQVLSAPDVEEREVEVPEWGGSVLIRTMTKANQVSLRKQSAVDGKMDEERFELLLFTHCVVEPRFTAEDHEALKAKSAAAMDRVLLAIYKVSGMDKAEVAKIERAFPGGAS